MASETISHFTILEKLGEGGMGVVHKAEDTRLKRTVALKFLPPHLLANEDERKRFVQEAQASAALSHSNIATVFEIDESDGKAFIALEYIEGQNLAALIASGPLSPDDALSIAIQTCEGLQAAHDNGIVHRDVKPQNIMITPKGQVKILDFGLAKLRGGSVLTTMGTTLGTMAYMSPEQLRGDPVDQRTDLWAFGVVLYEMLAGKRPFLADYDNAVAYQILNQTPSALTAIRPETPPRLESIVEKLLSKDIADRYQETKDLLTDLRSVKAAIEHGDSPPLPRRRPRGKRLPFYIAGAAVFLVLGGLSLSFLVGKKTASIDSVAVLPLENLSRDPDQAFFADGMTDALITELSQIKNLKVTSRTTVMRYRASDKTTPEIARDLGVEGIIEGSVQRSGDRVGITLQFIDARSDRTVWGKSFERNLLDVLTLQREVAHVIANEMRVSLTPDDEARLLRKTPVNPEAYQLYLKGRYFWDRRTREMTLRAIDCFKKAVEMDPGYAPAYAGLADCYLFQAPIPRSEAMPAARAAALKALQIDSTLSEAHATLGFVNMNFDWNWRQAESELKRSIEFNPNYAVAHQYYGGYLALIGRTREGVSEVRKALDLDPLSLAINWYLGYMLYLDRKYDESVVQYSKTLELQPDYPLAINSLRESYIQKGMYGPAETEYPQSKVAEGQRIRLYALTGRKEEAEARLRGDLKLPDQGGLTAYEIAGAYLSLGDKEKALYWLRQGKTEKVFSMFFLNVDPTFDPLRSDPRFSDLLVDLGFEPRRAN